LTKLWSIKLIATAIANPPELNFGRRVLYGALQTLHYDLIDMHKITPNIQEVVAFAIWLSVKQKSTESAKTGICAALPYLDPQNKCFPSSRFAHL
jgi:hypothetical protein